MEINNKITGSTLTANEFNQIPDELEGLISSSGQTPSNSDSTQIKKSIFQLISDGNFYETTGTDNNILLNSVTPRIAPFNLTNGMQIRFKAKYNNTGNTTINLNNLGEKKVTINGLDISANTLIEGKIYTATYLINTDSFELFNTGSLDADINLSNLSSTGEDHFTNKDLSNLSDTGNARLHALKGYLDEGELLTDAEGLADVKSYAHSTFDLSKFTIVDSPIVTDDGIASGFSSNDFLKSKTEINFSADKFKCKVKFNTSNLTVTQTLFANTYMQMRLLYVPAEDKLFASAYISNGQNSFSPRHTTYSIQANTDYFYELEYEYNKSFTLTILASDSLTVLEKYTTTNASYTSIKIPANGLIQIGKWAQTDYFRGSIDLKWVNITVDGVEVFNGNKTGIDTIKPDDYTVVGTPTISANGVASGFSDSNYLTQNLSISNATDFELISPVFYNILSSNRETVIMTPDTKTKTHLALWSNANDARALVVVFQDGTSTANRELLRVNFAITSGVGYQVKWVLKNGLWDVYYRTTENLEWVRLTKTSVTATDTVTINDLYIGKSLNVSGAYCRGSIDLNPLKVYVYGNLVYQPCLKIPYTESKTGSKIVQSIYRDRVWDMYEQFGYAPYYTLSDTDFTLPMGEIYGMIEKRARYIAHPVAVPFYRFDDTIYDDEVRLEGAEVDKGLYLAIEQNLSAYCTAGSTSDKICLPDFRDRVPWGANTQGYIEAGLPNITGNFGVMQYSYLDATGAFAIDTYKDNTGYEGGGFRSANISLNASRSSSIYNNNVTTVQPPAFKVRWLARFK